MTILFLIIISRRVFIISFDGIARAGVIDRPQNRAKRKKTYQRDLKGPVIPPLIPLKQVGLTKFFDCTSGIAAICIFSKESPKEGYLYPNPQSMSNRALFSMQNLR